MVSRSPPLVTSVMLAPDASSAVLPAVHSRSAIGPAGCAATALMIRSIRRSLT